MLTWSFLANLAKQGLGFCLAVIFGWLAYEKDREINRLNLRILNLMLMQQEAEELRHINQINRRR